MPLVRAVTRDAPLGVDPRSSASAPRRLGGGSTRIHPNTAAGDLVRPQATDIVSRVDAFLASTGGQLIASDGDYQRLIQELIEWAQRMHRRDILHWLGWAATAAAAAPVLAHLDDDERERTALALAQPARIDDTVVGHIEDVLWRTMRQDDALGPTAALETTLAQRNLVRSLLPSATGDIRDRLLSVYANTLRFAGWLLFDLNDYDAASQYFEQARTAAHDAHNTELGAFVLCNMSHLATWRGQPRTGIDHALAATGWAIRTDDNRLKAYAHDVAARAYAMDHQDTAGLSALDAARHLLTTAPDTPAGLVYFYNSGQLASTESTCYLHLGQHERGAAIAEQAMESINPAFVRNLALTSLRLGLCHLRSDRPDIPRAAEAISTAGRLAAHNRSARLVDRLQRSARELNQWRHIPEARHTVVELTSAGFAN